MPYKRKTLFLILGFTIVFAALIFTAVSVFSSSSANSANIPPYISTGKDTGTISKDDPDKNNGEDNPQKPIDPTNPIDPDAPIPYLIFLPHSGGAPNERNIYINQSLTMRDIAECNNWDNILKVTSNSDCVTVENIYPFKITALCAGNAEISIQIKISGAEDISKNNAADNLLTETKTLYITVPAPELPPEKNSYELTAAHIGGNVWRVSLFLNGAEIAYTCDKTDTKNLYFLDFDTAYITPDADNTFIIENTQNAEFRLVNLNLSCIIKL